MENPKPKVEKAIINGKSDVSEKVEWYLNEVSKSLDSDMWIWVKERIEKNMHVWLGEKLGQLKVSIVMDTNIVNSTLKRYAKGEPSIIFKLAENPLFTFYSPREIESEVQKFIGGKKAKGLDREKLREGWEKIRQIIIIKDVENDAARNAAMKIIGDRDPSDVPFVSLYIEMGAHAVLTYDNDYEIPSVRTFSMKGLNDTVGVFHRGMFSFFIMNDVLPFVLEILGKVIIAIVKGIFEILQLMWDLLKGMTSGAVDKVSDLISRIPPNAKKILGIILGIGLVILTVILISRKETRSKFSEAIKSVLNLIGDNAEKMINWIIDVVSMLIDLAKKAGPYAGMSLTVLTEIHSHLTTLSEEIKKMDLANAAHYS
ncbi:PIN domain-containing protein [Candidatus Nitrosotenuis chungbukensis]|uniref:PIN domain-containing protein n=1 Tax=Candidatus Nitrosotenuis chungbukensis TaxID=1353246 RepID=UPI0005B2A420|nr:PIN domain-containing protein [Candidatus Nitrosotenuis chungbukensis]WKT57926.1 PIN domain-containing protein [Candidatus Nitrosotenuis chungbukensis]